MVGPHLREGTNHLDENPVRSCHAIPCSYSQLASSHPNLPPQGKGSSYSVPKPYPPHFHEKPFSRSLRSRGMRR